ncbi:MAG: nucleotidyl transferase AbiEii/AbiGii toxin family protein [Candidatus Bathyarchaeota archaeon]
MISEQELRGLARERKLALDLVEKDYALGWILIGISKSTLSDKIIFKGGTALSKVHFPLDWRLSEDLDFTINEDIALKEVSTKLTNELPSLVESISGGLTLDFKKDPFMNDEFLRARVQYTGPISKNTVKIEVSTESFIGSVSKISVQSTYDYPVFDILSYTKENILAEKMRAILERGKIRDYYDVWRLVKENKTDIEKAKELFHKKCLAKDVEFTGVDQFFPEDIVATLEPYLEQGLTRLSSEPLPSLDEIINELKNILARFLINI